MGNIDQGFQLIADEKQYTLQSYFDGEIPLAANELLTHVIHFLDEWFNKKRTITQKTSGSTGMPKSIQVSKQHMIASAEATIAQLNLQPNDQLLLAISPAFIGGKMMIVRALIGQMTLIIGQVSGNPLQNIKENTTVDFFSFVPYQLNQILQHNQQSISILNKAKAIILGGAPVGENLHKKVKEQLSSPVYSTYGMTETVSHVALKLLNTSKASPYFKALPGISFSINENECLMIHAPHLTGHDMLKTNDVVKLIDSETFDWLGRYDFIINSGGIKIQAEQLEKAIVKLITKHQFNNSVLVFALPDENLGEKVALLIEGEASIIGLNDMLSALPKYHKPKEIYYLASFKYTAGEKLDRKASIAAALQ